LAFYSDTDASLGAYMLGIIINIFFMGMLTMQTWNYFHIFTEDRKSMKWYVGILYVINVLQTCCDCSLMYLNYAKHFGDINYFDVTNWLFWTEPALNGMIAFLVQSFFIHRTWTFMRRYTTARWLYLAIFVPSVILCLISSLVLAAALARVGRMSTVSHVKVEVVVWLVPASVVDVGLTTVLTILLYRSKTGFLTTDSILNSLVRLTMETGFLSAVVAVLDTIFYVAQSSENMTHMALQFPLGKLYTHSVMVTLHARAEQRRHLLNPSVHNKITNTWDSPGLTYGLESQDHRNKTTNVVVTQSTVIREEAIGLETLKNVVRKQDRLVPAHEQNYKWNVSTRRDSFTRIGTNSTNSDKTFSDVRVGLDSISQEQLHET